MPRPRVMPISYQSPTAGIVRGGRDPPRTGGAPPATDRRLLRRLDRRGLQPLDDVEAEPGRPRAVDHTMVEADGDVADLANDDLAVPYDGAIGDPVQPEDRDLRMVHERGHEETAELAGTRDGERRVAKLLRGERSRPRAVREPSHLDGDLLDGALLAAADDGDDQPVVCLHGDADVHPVEEHDVVSLQASVELGEPREGAGRRVDCQRDEEGEVGPGEVALLDEGDGRDLAVRARHLFDDRAADPADRNTPPVARPHRRTDVG